MTTTSGSVTAVESTELEHDNIPMPEDFIKDIKGAHYSQGGKYISGHADSFEELQTVVNRHAQVGAGEEWGVDIQG